MCSTAAIPASGDSDAWARSRALPPARTPGPNGAVIPTATDCTCGMPSSDSSSRRQKPHVRAASGY